MIKLLGKVPGRICVAVSGGSDSMSALNFLHNDGRRDVLALHFNHGTPHGEEAERFIVNYCKKNTIPLAVGQLTRQKLREESGEEFWRNERYSFFNDYSSFKKSVRSYDISHDSLAHFYYSNTPIITCHHLDDVVETWIFNSLHGNPMLIPYKRDNFIRPFLITEKATLTQWCQNKNVPYVTDSSNDDTSYMRNFIRHNIMPNALRVNPGLYKVIYKKIMNQYNSNHHVDC
jgi:tRNA(Ile)-lysidine synthase